MPDKRIKVAHILNSMGGVEIYVRLTVENCNPDLFTNIIIQGKNNKDKEYRDKNNNVIPKFILPITREIHVIKDIKAIYRTIRLLKREKPDIIHTHSAKGGLIGRVASFFYPVNVLYTPHAYSYLSTSNSLKRYFFLTVERILKYKSILVACSMSEYTRGIKEVGYKRSRVELFNNSVLPINPDAITSSFLHNLPKEYICTVGRPSYQKNIEMMVEVIREAKKEINNIHLVVMGVGEYYPNLEAVKGLIKEYNLEENITLVKWINRTDIFKIVSESKFYISTSRYEGLPYSMIEALALRKCFVVTACDGNKDLVIDQHNGYTIDENNVKKMAEKVVELYQNKQIRRKMELNSIRLFEKRYNLAENIIVLEKIYQKYSGIINNY